MKASRPYFIGSTASRLNLGNSHTLKAENPTEVNSKKTSSTVNKKYLIGKQ